MFRQSLAPDSAYVDVVVHGDGLTSLQFRTEAGGPTREMQCARQAPTAVRLEKRGDYVLLQLADINGKFEASGCTIKIVFKGVFYAGLAVCAHDNKAFEVGAVQARVAGASAEAAEICAPRPSKSFRSARWTAGSSICRSIGWIRRASRAPATPCVSAKTVD